MQGVGSNEQSTGTEVLVPFPPPDLEEHAASKKISRILDMSCVYMMSTRKWFSAIL